MLQGIDLLKMDPFECSYISTRGLVVFIVVGDRRNSRIASRIVDE
jgi:hypothetical protein